MRPWLKEKSCRFEPVGLFDSVPLADVGELLDSVGLADVGMLFDYMPLVDVGKLLEYLGVARWGGKENS